MTRPDTSPLRIGIAGLGTVGAGVVKLLAANAGAIAARAGRPVAVTAVSARSRGRDRGVDLAPYAWEDDAVRLAARDDVDCVVEVVGGSNGPAKALVEAALAAGKPVVTANKALIAHHGQALAEAAEAAGVALRAEAGVAGGIPVMKALTEGLAANRIHRVSGVLNGTCNYILTEMAATGRGYAEVLAEAQAKGYAEADPAFDVGGTDAAHKLAILAAAAFGTRVDFAGVTTEGIERITAADIETAGDLGFAIKLLAVARMEAGGLEQRVRPTMVPRESLIGSLPGVTNAVVLEGDFVGTCAFTGPGAGEGPTASAIVADLMDIARGAAGPLFAQPAAGLRAAERLDYSDEHAPYYLRFSLLDRPGALAALASAIGEAGVSIHRMRQYGRGGARAGAVPVVIVTHDARREMIDGAVARIAALDVSAAEPVAIAIEEI
ncbi:homoserine dehydrogenase [Paralimibaculum aggregatum]|uniref:Homoserine dehydrogenase n=1 Tax=Paralimibaculum aggregatum TaxID=3036245 RepID=A0ABQ6LBQ7_9RHOB|nr:homoserine dehydrogenase [Limibaculum sp. NKW23]GMG80823.1 homoserine dehydrogenase [Limibaculum sp. NKW23]